MPDIRLRQDVNRFYTDFGEILRSRRKAAALTQKALADRTGLSRTTVTALELGNQQIALHTFVEICRCLEVQPNELIPNSAQDILEAMDPKHQDLVHKLLRKAANAKD